MAMRVRKLARELGRSPNDVLGLLHAVGYTRYKNPQDMLSDAVVDRVRRAERDGVKPEPVVVATKKAAPKAQPKAPASDLMSQLVPGVQPQRDGRFKGAGAPPAAKRAPATAAAAPTPAAATTPQAAAAPAAGNDRGELDAEWAKLRDEQAALADARAALAADRATLETERAAFVADRDVFEQQRRAVEVQAAAEQEAAQAAADEELLGELGDALLLHGLRRLVVIGGTPADLKQLRHGLDRRIEIRFAAGDRGRSEAEQDVARTDAVLLWGATANEDARAVYGASRATLLELPASPFGPFVSTLLKALRDDTV